VFHEEALYQVYLPLPLPLLWEVQKVIFQQYSTVILIKRLSYF